MEWVAGILKPLIAFTRGLNRLLRTIPVVADFEDRLKQRWLSQVVVRRIRRPDDPDLASALDLYSKRIDGDFRFEAADIVRWIEDDFRRREKTADDPRDYFLAAKFHQKVKAFVLLHYYPRRKIAFLAYMVVDRNSAGLGLDELSIRLVEKISSLLSHDRLMRNCEMIVFEVEDPRKSPKPKQLHNIARIQRFCTLAATQSFTLRAFDVPYLQPVLGLPDGAKSEEPLLLISARRRTKKERPNVDSELREILDFIYFDLYPEGFSDLPEEQAAFIKYCHELHDRVITSLPPKVNVINPAHLTCGRAVRKAYVRNRKATGKDEQLAGSSVKR